MKRGFSNLRSWRAGAKDRRSFEQIFGIRGKSVCEIFSDLRVITAVNVSFRAFALHAFQEKLVTPKCAD
jgi:hypothetical protein